MAAGIADNPFLHALADAGVLRADACDRDLRVDEQERAVGVNGRVFDVLRIVGPPASGPEASRNGFEVYPPTSVLRRPSTRDSSG